MDKENLFKRNGSNVFRVDKIHNLSIETLNIDPRYKVSKDFDMGLSSTGLLVVFEVLPKDSKVELPSFVARWDQNKETMDIDMLGPSQARANLFKGGKEGYSGHHPVRMNVPSRTYDVAIKIPECEVFAGRVTFNINHGHESGLFG